ncbi:G-protein coupled receptor 39-like [Mantella aurantiaca]
MPPVRTAPETPVRLSNCAKSLVSLVYILLLLAGILGNTIVIRVLQGLRGRRGVQISLSYHMCSLASCDILQLALGIPAELYGSIWSPFPWPLGAVGCSGFYYLWEVLCYSAIFNVLSLSCERHRATCQPLSLLRQSSRVRLRLCLLWLTSFLAGLPMLLSIGLETINVKSIQEKPFEVQVCTPLHHWMGLFTTSVCISFLTYLGVLMVVCVTCWRMRRALQSNTSLEFTGPNGSIQISGRFFGGHTAERRQNAKLLGWIVGVLAVCWLPFQARRLMTIVRSKDQWTESYYRSYITLQPITNCFYYLSACLTPLLYNLTSRNFRRCFLHSISPCIRRPPPESGSWDAQTRYQGIRLSKLGQETSDM